ncbi:MAG: hypothetical protein JSS38_17750 [Nitrospira sp.]|nr:hypothetical protein [Nitrospira sp.]
MAIAPTVEAKSIEQTLVTITCSERFEPQDARYLRGVFAGLYPNRPEFHGHGPRGLVYEHPRIQYKVLNGQGVVVGVQEGAFLLQLVQPLARLRLGTRWLDVISMDRIVRMVPFGLADAPFEYKFVTPWVALNEENHPRFETIRFQRKEEALRLLRKILIGNLLSLSKALGYEVPGPIFAEVKVDEPIEVSLKPEVVLLGFLGRFRTNFWIPPLWGIGKQSARGFGAVERIA